MSEINEFSPPNPPPPPPPSLPAQEGKITPFALNKEQPIKENDNELNEGIKRLISDDEEVFYLTNTKLKSQLQDGPKCGLVALSMASSLRTFFDVEDVFNLALSLGFTKHGEMFDAGNLAVLAEKCGFQSRLINGGLSSHLCCIVNSLIKKCLLLVPYPFNYDADFNHSPCCKKGTKAHWAVITGFLVTKPVGVGNVRINSKSSTACLCDNSSQTLLQGRLTIGKTSTGSLPEGRVFLIGLQGKSRHIGLWSFDEMSDSNNNLVCFSTNRNSESYVLPDGGLSCGLKGRAIVLKTS